jgi:hypothetical protein
MNTNYINRKLVQQIGLGISMFCLGLLIGISPALAQSSVEKSETSQQAKRPEDELARARNAVAKPNEKQEAVDTGRVLGDYVVNSSIELGYRWVDTNGNRNRYLSDVNVREGFRVFDFSMDAHSISGNSPLFDFFRADVSNAGGDQSQYFSLRADKTRVYKFDATVRRFNYFRSLSVFALNEHNYDLRQQVSDYNLKLFPQRAVRLNLGYARSMAKGTFSSTFDSDRDEFPILGRTRWEANDYHAGIDATYHGWDFFVDHMYRGFKNDTTDYQDVAVNLGNNPTNTSVLTLFDRDSPTRSHTNITRGSLRGSLASNLHLTFRALHSEENLDLAQFEPTAGTDASGNTILSRSFVANSKVERPSTSIDGALSYDVNDYVSISNTVQYHAYRIDGNFNSLTTSSLRSRTGVITNSSVTDTQNRLVDLDSLWNTLQFQITISRKFSANLGWRFTHRNVTLTDPAVDVEEEDQNTNSFIGGVRFRPNNRVNMFFDYERGESDNAFVRINPLEYHRGRVRANFQINDKLSLDSTFSVTQRTNPTRFVENDSNYRAFSISANWDPIPRVWVSGGFDHDRVVSTANIAFLINNVLNQGRSRYYARQNFVFLDSRIALTKRLDAFLVYRYVKDLGAPSFDPLAPVLANDFVTSLPLVRHNPEARLSYRFSNHFTGNISYRHYSYNEQLATSQDYRTNIVTTSARFTF